MSNDSVNQAISRYRAPALDKGLDILELLAGSDRGASQVEIARQLGRTQSEIYRMLETLRRRGYVHRNRSEGRYYLGIKLSMLKDSDASMRRFISGAVPHMKDAVHRSLQSCHLCLNRFGQIVIVAKIEPQGVWSVSMNVDTNSPCGNAAILLTVAAFSSRDRTDELVREVCRGRQRHDWNERHIRKKVSQIRKTGFARMQNPTAIDVTDLAFPINSIEEDALGAVFCPHLKRECDNADMKTVVEVMSDLAKTLSAIP